MKICYKNNVIIIILIINIIIIILSKCHWMKKKIDILNVYHDMICRFREY